MRSTGQLTFTRQPDDTLFHEWTGGRRIEVSDGLLVQMGLERPFKGKTVQAGEILLRIVGFGEVGLVRSTETRAGHYVTYVAMREGRLARAVLWYDRQAYRLVNWLSKPRVFRILHGRDPDYDNGENISDWLGGGILLKLL